MRYEITLIYTKSNLNNKTLNVFHAIFSFALLSFRMIIESSNYVYRQINKHVVQAKISLVFQPIKINL